MYARCLVLVFCVVALAACGPKTALGGKCPSAQSCQSGMCMDVSTVIKSCKIHICSTACTKDSECTDRGKGDCEEGYCFYKHWKNLCK